MRQKSWKWKSSERFSTKRSIRESTKEGGSGCEFSGFFGGCQPIHSQRLSSNYQQPKSLALELHPLPVRGILYQPHYKGGMLLDLLQNKNAKNYRYLFIEIK